MPYKDPEVNRMKHREYGRRFRIKHREKLKAAHKAYHAAHRDELNRKRRAYNRAHKAEIQAHNKRYYATHKTGIKEKVRRWREKNPDIVLSYIRRAFAKIRKRKTVDATFYAKCRACSRISNARMNILRGMPYRPRFNRRIPDWAVMGGGIDYNSQWLLENSTPSQRAFIRDLQKEHNEWRMTR